MGLVSNLRGRVVALFLSLSVSVTPAQAGSELHRDPPPRAPAPDTCARWENPTFAPDRPPFRTNHVAVLDVAHRRMIVCGGDLQWGQSGSDVWICSLDRSRTWTRLANVDPSPPFIHSPGLSGVFDSRRNRVIVLGTGSAGTSEAWALTLDSRPQWTQLAVAGPSPQPVTEASALYDEASDRMLVFGGKKDDFETRPTLNTVSSLSLGDTPAWTELHPSGELPSPREEATTVYDSRHHRMVVFGGTPWSQDVPPDSDRVWLLSLDTNPAWSNVAPIGPHPLARRAHAACYDPLHDEMIILGGFGLWDHQSEGPLDAWGFSLDRMQWSRIDTPRAPLGRNSASALFDVKGHRVIMFGGQPVGGYIANECWSLSLDRRPEWELISPPAGPPFPEMGGRGVFDRKRRRLIFAQYDRSVWALSLSRTSQWQQVLPPSPAADRPTYPNFWSALLLDAARDRVLGFDGRDLWALGLDSGTAWEKLSRLGDLPPRSGEPSLVLDPIGDRVLMCGGCIAQGDGTHCGATNLLLSYDLSQPSEWKRLAIPGDNPPPMYFHSGIFDPKRRRMVISGGHAFGPRGEQLPRQAWALSLQGEPVWTKLGIAGPSALSVGPFAVYDELNDRILDLGYAGTSFSSLSLRDNRITSLAPTGTPPEETLWRYLASDPAANRLVIYGPNQFAYEHRQELMFAQFKDCESDGDGRGRSDGDDKPGRGHHRPQLTWTNATAFAERPVLSLTLASVAPATIEAFDITGRRVWQEGSAGSTGSRAATTLRLPASLPQGVYLVRATQAGEWASTRVVVLK